MQQLKAIQDGFRAAANQFISLSHLVVCTEPEAPTTNHASINVDHISSLNLPDELTARNNHVDYWQTDLDEHYLIKGAGADWNKQAALCSLRALAVDMLDWLYDHKDEPLVARLLTASVDGFGNPVYRWLLILRHLTPNRGLHITGGQGNTRRAAKDGEPYFSVFDNIFLQSVAVIGKLINDLQPDEIEVVDDAPEYDPVKPVRLSKQQKIAAIAAHLAQQPFATLQDISTATSIHETAVSKLWGKIKRELRDAKRYKPPGTKNKGTIQAVDITASCGICREPLNGTFHCRYCADTVIGECKTCHTTNNHPDVDEL